MIGESGSVGVTERSWSWVAASRSSSTRSRRSAPLWTSQAARRRPVAATAWGPPAGGARGGVAAGGVAAGGVAAGGVVAGGVVAGGVVVADGVVAVGGMAL